MCRLNLCFCLCLCLSACVLLSVFVCINRGSEALTCMDWSEDGHRIAIGNEVGGVEVVLVDKVKQKHWCMEQQDKLSC